MGDVTPFTRCKCGKGALSYSPPEHPEHVFALCESCIKACRDFYERFKNVAAAMRQAGMTDKQVGIYMRLLMGDYLPPGLAEAVSTSRGIG